MARPDLTIGEAIDTRTAGALLQQYRTIQTVKNSLIKEGILTGDATVAHVLTALRQMLPADEFVRQTPRAKKAG